MAPGPGLLYHPTVDAYRKILDPEDHHRVLDDPSTYNALLGPPTDEWTGRIDTLVDDASHILRVVLKRLKGPVLAQADREVFADLFGPWNGDKWNRVRDNIRKLKPFADDPDSVDLTLALGDEHLFKIGADWHEDFHDDSNSDSQDEADSASQPVFIEGSRRQEITGPLRGGETRYFVDTTIAGVADAHTPDEVPETALFPGNHFGTYASVGCQKQSVCAHVAHNVSGPGWGDRSQQTRDIVYVCSQDILSSDEPFLRSPACYDPEYDPHGPDVDLERDPEWQRSALGGPPAILIHELFHTFALMGGDGGEPWLDQVVRLNGQDRKLYEELCFDVPKTPRNVRRCLKNPDSYAQFITEMFLLEQGWRWDKGSGRWIRYSDNYEEPANTKAKDV